jgi:selenide,water dikinase
MTIKLTQYSHGAGCGCKISPKDLDKILTSDFKSVVDKNLLVGNDSRDDAAVYDLGNGTAVVSTTDFFMPIVDDANTFGRIAATNAISDIYAMGGKPLMAIAILGWPLDKLPAEVAGQVIDGARAACADAGIQLAGGHSIDSPEPIFGLAVTGLVDVDKIKKNNSAKAGDLLYLTKPLGIGILSTAQKRAKLSEKDKDIASDLMCQMNTFGQVASQEEYIHAMTDVTGFGLLGHLLEMCQGSNLGAKISTDRIPIIPQALVYLEQGCIPGGTLRNWDSYGEHYPDMPDKLKNILCDPQTSGGLLMAVDAAHKQEFEALAKNNDLELISFGCLKESKTFSFYV